MLPSPALPPPPLPPLRSSQNAEGDSKKNTGKSSSSGIPVETHPVPNLKFLEEEEEEGSFLLRKQVKPSTQQSISAIGALERTVQIKLTSVEFSLYPWSEPIHLDTLGPFQIALKLATAAGTSTKGMKGTKARLVKRIPPKTALKNIAKKIAEASRYSTEEIQERIERRKNKMARFRRSKSDENLLASELNLPQIRSSIPSTGSSPGRRRNVNTALRHNENITIWEEEKPNLRKSLASASELGEDSSLLEAPPPSTSSVPFSSLPSTSSLPSSTPSSPVRSPAISPASKRSFLQKKKPSFQLPKMPSGPEVKSSERDIRKIISENDGGNGTKDLKLSGEKKLGKSSTEKEKQSQKNSEKNKNISRKANKEKEREKVELEKNQEKEKNSEKEKEKDQKIKEKEKDKEPGKEEKIKEKKQKKDKDKDKELEKDKGKVTENERILEPEKEKNGEVSSSKIEAKSGKIKEKSRKKKDSESVTENEKTFIKKSKPKSEVSQDIRKSRKKKSEDKLLVPDSNSTTKSSIEITTDESLVETKLSGGGLEKSKKKSLKSSDHVNDLAKAGRRKFSTTVSQDPGGNPQENHLKPVSNSKQEVEGSSKRKRISASTNSAALHQTNDSIKEITKKKRKTTTSITKNNEVVKKHTKTPESPEKSSKPRHLSPNQALVPKINPQSPLRRSKSVDSLKKMIVPPKLDLGEDGDEGDEEDQGVDETRYYVRESTHLFEFTNEMKWKFGHGYHRQLLREKIRKHKRNRGANSQSLLEKMLGTASSFQGSSQDESASSSVLDGQSENVEEIEEDADEYETVSFGDDDPQFAYPSKTLVFQTKAISQSKDKSSKSKQHDKTRTDGEDYIAISLDNNNENPEKNLATTNPNKDFLVFDIDVKEVKGIRYVTVSESVGPYFEVRNLTGRTATVTLTLQSESVSALETATTQEREEVFKS